MNEMRSKMYRAFNMNEIKDVQNLQYEWDQRCTEPSVKEDCRTNTNGKYVNPPSVDKYKYSGISVLDLGTPALGFLVLLQYCPMVSTKWLSTSGRLVSYRPVPLCFLHLIKRLLFVSCNSGAWVRG